MPINSKTKWKHSGEYLFVLLLSFGFIIAYYLWWKYIYSLGLRLSHSPTIILMVGMAVARRLNPL